MFEFAGGALSVVPSGGNTEVSFELFNVGDQAGNAEVGVEVDGTLRDHVELLELQPGWGDTPRIRVGYIQPGTHEALV